MVSIQLKLIELVKDVLKAPPSDFVGLEALVKERRVSIFGVWDEYS
jgi:hypothetical protein